MQVSGLLVAVLVLAAGHAAAEDRFDVEITGAGSSRDAHCDDGQSVRISGADHRIDITGKCKLVVVDVADNVVKLDRADVLRVFGSKQQVDVREAVRELEVHGADHAITANVAGEGAGVEVSGGKNRLTVTLQAKARLAVTGADHDVTYRLAPGGPKPTIQVTGLKNRVHEDRKPK